MAGRTYTRLTLVALAPSGNRDASEAILELLRERYGDALAARLPTGTEVKWHARIASDVIDFAALTLNNGGYLNGDAEHAAEWVAACCQAWLEILQARAVADAALAATVAKALGAGQDTGQDPEGGTDQGKRSFKRIDEL